MKRFFLGLLFSLLTSSAFAQALPVCNWGDMIYKASTNYACLPYDNTPGKFLQGQGAGAQPIWTFQAAAGFLLPTQSTNTFLGNTTGGTASPTPNTVSQILDTIGYDISRPAVVGGLIYKSNVAPNNAWQALAPPVSSGQVLSFTGGAPIWISNIPTLDGFCTTQGAVLFRTSIQWQCLPPGTAGQLLTTNGASQDLNWATVSTTSLGAVPTTRQVATGTGLSGGGDLSANRTLSIANTIAAAGPIGSATTAPAVTYNAQGQLTAVSSVTITPPFSALMGQITLAQMTTLAANRTLGNGTGSSAVPTALAMPSCSGANQALQWLSGTGYQCVTLGTGGTVSSATIAAGSGVSVSGTCTITTTGTCTVASLAPPTAGPYVTSVTLTSGSGSIAPGRTYTGTSIGAAAANRTVVVVDGFRDTPNCPLASMTIGGVAATRVAQQANSATNTTIMSIWTAAVPTGTTATIVTVYCGNVDSAEALGVYALYGLTTCFIASSGSSSATAPAMSVPVPSGGTVIGGAWALGQTSAISWFGSLADYALLSDPTSTSQYQYGVSSVNNDFAKVVDVTAVYGASCG